MANALSLDHVTFNQTEALKNSRKLFLYSFLTLSYTISDIVVQCYRPTCMVDIELISYQKGPGFESRSGLGVTSFSVLYVLSLRCRDFLVFFFTKLISAYKWQNKFRQCGKMFTRSIVRGTTSSNSTKISLNLSIPRVFLVQKLLQIFINIKQKNTGETFLHYLLSNFYKSNKI